MSAQQKNNVDWGAVAKGVGITAAAVVAWKLLGDSNDAKDYNSMVNQWCTDNLDESLLTHDLPWYNISADRIANAVWRNGSGWTEDDATVRDILLQLNNDADYMKLTCAYGARPPWFWFQRLTYGSMNLAATIDKFLNEGMIDEVNEDWIAKGMEPLADFG